MHQEIALYEACDLECAVRRVAWAQEQDRTFASFPVTHARDFLGVMSGSTSGLFDDDDLRSLPLERARDLEAGVSENQRVLRIPT